MQVPHVRETIADRELETWMLIDQSASLDFGTADCEKRDLAVNGAASVGFLTARSGNRLGAILLRPGDAPVVVPARSGRAAPAGAAPQRHHRAAQAKALAPPTSPPGSNASARRCVAAGSPS